MFKMWFIFFVIYVSYNAKALDLETDQLEDQSVAIFPDYSTTEADAFETTTLENCVPVIKDGLGFHSRSGSSVAVTNDGKVAYVKYKTMYGFRAALTNRTLGDGEMFSVKIDSSNRIVNANIGVTVHSPEEVEYGFNFDNIGAGVWVWRTVYNEVLRNGKVSIGITGPTELKSGDILGVKRKWDGTLLFFYNGKNLGPGAYDVPDNVYGYVELTNKRASATILDGNELTNHVPED